MPIRQLIQTNNHIFQIYWVAKEMLQLENFHLFHEFKITTQQEYFRD